MTTDEKIELEYTNGFEQGMLKRLEIASLMELEQERESTERTYYRTPSGPVRAWFAGYLDGLTA